MLDQLLAAGKSAGGAIQGALNAIGDVGSMVYSSKKNLGSAQDARRFQRNMSNTAYQRAAKDLEAAGLNRILAVGSPASSPSAPTATTPDAKAGSAFSAGSSAASVRRVNAETINLLREQQANVRAQTQTEADKQANLRAQTQQTIEGLPNIPKQGVLLDKQADNYGQQTLTSAAQADYLVKQAENLGLEIDKNEIMKIPYQMAAKLLEALQKYFFPEDPPSGAKPVPERFGRTSPNARPMPTRPMPTRQNPKGK